MRFYSRLVFICNLCFIATVIFRSIERSAVEGNNETLIRIPYLQGLVAILGYGAIFLNFIFVILCLYLLFGKKLYKVPRWLTIFNIMIFVAQVAFQILLITGL